jgi:transcriptional regulator with XRE-family HTH domain
MDFNGNKLKDLRKRAGLTQVMLAHEIGSTMASVSNWEIGKNDPPYGYISKLCEYFNVTEDYFDNRPLDVQDSIVVYIKGEDGKSIQLRFVEPDERRTPGDVEHIGDNVWEMAIEPIRCHFIGPVHGSVMVRNSAMEPEFNSRNAVAVRLLKQKTAVTPGEVYFVIDSNQEGHLRRLYPEDDGRVRMVSNRTDVFPDYTLRFSDIFLVFKVKANITLF